MGAGWCAGIADGFQDRDNRATCDAVAHRAGDRARVDGAVPPVKMATARSGFTSLVWLAAAVLAVAHTVGCSQADVPKLYPEVCDVIEERLTVAESELEGYYAAVSALVDAGLERRDAQRKAQASIDEYCPEYAGLYKNGHL